MIFDNNFPERIKEYRKAAEQMQVLLKAVYPNFLARENRENDLQFLRRLKDWRKENPETVAMVNTNYPLNSEQHTSLVGNIGKILPQAEISDDFDKEICEKNRGKVESYLNKTWYLGVYSHIEKDMMTYCWTRGLEFNRNRTWGYFRKYVLSREDYDRWCKFRLLRNNLSHNHLSGELAVDLTTAINDDFSKYVINMYDFLKKNTPVFTKQEDGTFLAVHSDGLRVVVDMDKMTVLSCWDKDGKEIDKSSPSIGSLGNGSNVRAEPPVKVRCWDGELVDCRFDDGIYVNLKRQKICFPDGARIYFDADEHNYFMFDRNRMFTDKQFEITKFYERNKYRDIGKNEDRVVAMGHRIRTDSRRRITEDTITLSDGRKLKVKFRYDNGNAAVILPDGTKLDTSKGKFTISHNGIVLNFANRYRFEESYANAMTSMVMQKTTFER